MHGHRRDYGLLLLLGSIWGGSFLFIKMAVVDIPPMTVAAIRIVIGAVVLAAVAAGRGQNLWQLRHHWRPLLIMGSLGTMLPFALIGWGETNIDSGLAAILMAAVPFSTILLAHIFVHEEPLSWGKILGCVLGFAGVVVLIGPAALSQLGGQALAQIAVLLATVCYAVNSIIARQLSHFSGEAAGAGMLIAAALFAVPLSLALDRPWNLAPSGTALFAVTTLGWLCTGVGYLLFFRIIASAGAGFVSLNNFMVPLFGVIWGAIVLGERLEPRAFIALVLILAGVAAPRLLRGRRAAAMPQLDKPNTSAIE
jgi:drug/metabolite transporter (DMT)-like permease